jgi:hypothetical protein
MKTFVNMCAQGDVVFRRIDALPDGLKEVAPVNGRLVITHSETGHDHVMVLERDAEPAVRMYSGDNPLIAWLEVNRPVTLEHLRNFDTHDPIQFDPGKYEIRRQREYTPEGFRRVDD